MRDIRAWRVYLVFALLFAVAYPLAPQSVWKGELCFDLFGALSVAAIVHGVVRHRPGDRLPWLLFALGQGLFVVGDLIFSLYDVVLHESPFPSAADGLYLAAYPALAGGLVVLVRRRRSGQDWAALLDAAIVTVGLGSLSWAMLMAPYTRDPSLSRPELAISLAYPLADVLLLAVAVRLLFGGGRRSASLLLVGLSLASLLITDAVYGWLSLHGRYVSGGPLDVGWIVSYALFGLAALHPSMREVSASFSETARRFPVWRLALLAVALATAPVALAVESARLAVDRARTDPPRRPTTGAGHPRQGALDRTGERSTARSVRARPGRRQRRDRRHGGAVRRRSRRPGRSAGAACPRASRAPHDHGDCRQPNRSRRAATPGAERDLADAGTRRGRRSYGTARP